MDQIYERLTAIFHDLFDDDGITLSPELTAKDVAEWDSLRHIQLILAVQKAFKIKFSAADTVNLKNVGELVALIKTKAR